MLFEPLFAHADQPAAGASRSSTTAASTPTSSSPRWRPGWACTSPSRPTSRASACCCRPRAGFVASFYGTLLAGKTRRADQLPARRPRDRPHHRRTAASTRSSRSRSSPARLKDTAAQGRSTSPQLPQTPARRDHAASSRSPTADDLAVLMYTSGTSGLPKGVMLTYGNLQSDVDAAIEHVAAQAASTSSSASSRCSTRSA